MLFKFCMIFFYFQGTPSKNLSQPGFNLLKPDLTSKRKLSHVGFGRIVVLSLQITRHITIIVIRNEETPAMYVYLKLPAANTVYV